MIHKFNDGDSTMVSSTSSTIIQSEIATSKIQLKGWNYSTWDQSVSEMELFNTMGDEATSKAVEHGGTWN